MKNLITYLFILFIGLNLIVSLYGWHQSNKEKGILYNRQTEIIDSVWQVNSIKNNPSKTESVSKNKTFNIPTHDIIIKLQNFINAVVKAKPAFQHTYIEIYGNLYRLLGRNYMEDSNEDNDIVRLPNGQLNFIGKLNNVHTYKNPSIDSNIAIEQLKYLKEYTNCYSPNTKLYFIIRPHKGYNKLPYGLKLNNNKINISQIQQLGFNVLDLNYNVPQNRHRAFYHTDHHWRVEYAFTQIPTICKFIGIDDNIYTHQNFKLINTKRKFTGSLTRRTGNGFITLSDTFKYYRPSFYTEFIADYYSENKIIHRKGNFDQTLLFLEKQQDQQWDANLYSICNQGDNPLVRIKNNNIDKNRILLLGDSFSAPIISYLSLALKEIDCIDLRSCSPDILLRFIRNNHYDKILLIYPEYYDKRMYNFKS